MKKDTNTGISAETQKNKYQVDLRKNTKGYTVRNKYRLNFYTE